MDNFDLFALEMPIPFSAKVGTCLIGYYMDTKLKSRLTKSCLSCPSGLESCVFNLINWLLFVSNLKTTVIVVR